MTTRAKNNIDKPLTKVNLIAVLSQPSDIEPHTINQALIDPKLRQAMNDEFDALVRNGTWELVPSTSITNTNIIQLCIDLLAQRFSIKDLGVLSYFLGIEVLTTPSGVLLTQRRYISNLLAWTKMSGAKPIATPLVIDGNLTLHSVARSSTKAEYRSVAATTSEINWICSILIELGVTLPTPPVIYCDNVGATYLYSNLVFHSHMKHVEIDYHFIRDQVQSGALRVTHVSSTDQLVDALTKPLP
ncbi:Retrovirus-related Pol polyprotein from transposon RE1 [Vitis vinifera]|uniref:Retrovirus-related Pol polyprotein from transposon RE1 n=1 Tax=Vitis vinifera TaxID=29760 RepID=A0A438GRG9_VITVI|nr:Retrovirus-related Pol polyprotein from transposon RE1 [Vitis vinifera]